jgi:hypothetical protein
MLNSVGPVISPFASSEQEPIYARWPGRHFTFYNGLSQQSLNNLLSSTYDKIFVDKRW